MPILDQSIRSMQFTSGGRARIIEANRLKETAMTARYISPRHSKLATVLRVSSGNFMEMFDFFLFGFYAAPIARTFFPNGNEFAALMLTFMTFGAGFLMRPLGAIFLGAYVDRVGRRKGLVVTLSLMAAGTMLIAFVPGYAVLGLAAPVLVVAGRLLQGFSAGVELGGVSVYLSEMATPGHKGFYVAWQSASQQVAIVVAAALGYALNLALDPQQVADWGWRIPFFVGCLIVPVLFMIRRTLQETEEFSRRTHRPDARMILRSMCLHWGLVVSGMLLVAMTTVSFYLITVYTPTFGRSVLRLSTTDSLVVTVCVGVSNFLWLPVMGALSDRTGRRPLLLLFAALTILTAYPALAWLTASPSFGRMLAVELWLSFLSASYNGAMVVALTEVMPVDVRTSGFSLAYSLATAIFGGFTPAIATALIEATGNKAAPGLWMTFAAACGLVATLMLYRSSPVTAGIGSHGRMLGHRKLT
jgi:MHS family citrate/tricarballylate:H+ symporter-like MFS transporter